MDKEDKQNKKIAIDFLDIVSGFFGDNPKSNFIKGRLRKEIKRNGNEITTQRLAE